MSRLFILMVVTMSSCGCMTFKTIDNKYEITGVAIIKEAPQTVSGSDADDSFNGNEVKPKVSAQ